MTATELAAAEKADLAQATSHADAVRRVLNRRGITVDDYVTQRVADAVLGYADNTMSVRESMPRHPWQDPGVQEHMLQQLRRKLLEEITSQGLVPTALPTQTLAYQSWRYGNEQPLRASEAEPAEWDTVEVTLTVPVRVPPVDRKAAVKAGILSGGTR
jgi:hypothetical protein